ncbi:MAG: translocation/assembly module TamB domain-containing protein [Acidobacteriia bacterium]|nr:translocation/assembly module TamB domain-containing protein [Terriglobia bacterium]
MTEDAHVSRRRLLPAMVGIAVLAIVAGAAWYLTSARFNNYLRGRLVARLESVTGGRVELGKVEWKVSKLSLAAENLTIHGLEGPKEAPYVHADRVALQLKVVSVARRKIGLQYLELNRPVIHLIVHPDGSTNQPTPKAGRSGSSLQPLFALQADRVEVRDGVLLLNDRRVPLDLSARDLQAQMSYAVVMQRYDGSISAQTIRLAYGDYEPFDSSVSATFSLARNQLEVKSVKLGAGNSLVEGAGRMDDFNHPRVTMNYQARLDLAQIGDLTRLAQLRGGVLELKGSGAFTAEDFTTSGMVRMQNLEYRDPAIRIPDLDGGAEFKSEHNTLTVPHLFAHALGGSVTGNLEIRNWTSALKPGARAGLVSPAADGVAHLRLRALSVSRIAAAISTRALPANKLNPVGLASGTLDVTFRGSPAHSHARFGVQVTPVRATPQQLPVQATIRGSYAIDTLALDLVELNATARSLTLEASGTMARNNHLRVALKVGNLRDLDALLTSLRGATRLPEGLTGRATFTGALTGTVAAPQLAGEVGLADFTLPVPLKRLASVKQASAPARLAHFDSFTAHLRYSRSQLALNNARLRRGTEDLLFTFSTALDQGEFRTTLPLTLSAEIRNFQVNDLQGIFGFDYPLTGVTTASLQVKGTADDPIGSGHLRITNATLAGEAYPSVGADVVFANQEAQLSNLIIAHNGARVTGTAAYNLKSTGFRFHLQGSNFSLAQFKQLQLPRLSVAGRLDFNARGSGTTSRPVVDADLHLRDVVLNQERMGNVDAKAVTSAGVMKITARSDRPAAEFMLDGTVNMYDDFPAQLALRFTRLDVDALLHGFLQGRATGHSSITGTVTLAGPLRQPRLLTITGDISEFSAEMENVRVHNDGPLRFKVASQVVTLEQFRLAGEENTQMTATGTIALSGARALDLRAEGNVHLKLLQIWNPALHAGGMVEFNINARGDLTRPVLFGRAKFNHATLTHVNFPNGLSDINGVIVFNQDRMQIQSLTATSGGGTMTLGGFVSYANGLAFNLTGQGRSIRLRYPQGVSTVLDCDLRLSGTTSSSTLTGTVTVTRFGMTPQFDLGLAIARARQAPGPPNPRSPLNNLRLAVRVVSTPELQVQTSLARLTGGVDLNLRGTASRPILLGKVNVTEGQVTLNGTNYQLERGDISFSNPVRIEPVLDVEATTRVRDYDITLGFHGPLDRLGTTYRSDPPLPTSDIIALLAFGRTREESVMATEANPSFTESASSAILSQALNSAGSTRMQRLFGVSRIKISPEVAGSEALDPNARLTIEQQVTRDFTVTYVTDITHSGQQIIQVEYNYSRNLSILATRDQYGVLSFDVRIKRRRR